MSETYSPNRTFSPTGRDTTVFLSQRDLGLTVPINYVNTPGVTLTSACFGNGRYEDDNFGDCLSNLLALQYQRLIADLYWDGSRSVWSFCPVQIPNRSAQSVSNTVSGTLATNSTLSSSTESDLHSRQVIRARNAQGGENLITATSVDDSPEISPTGALGSALPSISTAPDGPDGMGYTVGGYVCTDTIQLSTMTTLLFDYLQRTENNLAAHLLYLTLNIHEAAAPSNLSSATGASATLPQKEQYLGAYFQNNFTSYLYTPEQLRSDRNNLNDSWYEVAERYRPAEEYYKTTRSPTGIVATENGWPTEYYIEFIQRRRLLLQYGSIDARMRTYNTSNDDNVIFESNYLSNNWLNLSVSSNGDLQKGCLLDNADTTNASWASASTSLLDTELISDGASNITSIVELGSNYTACGFSPVLNTTTRNATADMDYVTLYNFGQSSIWSWASKEPRNYSDGDADEESLFRCATLSRQSASRGRWRAADCSAKYYTACRLNGQPHNWTISTYPVSYSFAGSSCPDGHTFAAPRTALENGFLNRTMSTTNRDYDDHGPWIDINSLDERGCWVANGGPNAACPYLDSSVPGDLRQQFLLGPAIAALVVLCLTAILVFGKVAGNKRSRRKTRKKVGADVYEGIPS